MNFKRGQIKAIAKLINPTENKFSKIKMEKENSKWFDCSSEINENKLS